MVTLIALTLIVSGMLAPNFYKRNKVTSYQISGEQPDIRYKLQIEPDKNSDDDIFYKPNLNSFTGVSVSTEHLSLGVSVESPNTDEEDDLYEKSNVVDVQLVGVYGKVLWDLYYQNYQGLYILEDEDLIDKGQSPEADSFNYGIEIKYFSSDKYSIRHSLGNFASKKQTAWSTVHGIQLGHSKLHSSDSLIPDNFESRFPDTYGITGIELRSFGYEYGITGMYSLGALYISGLVSLGAVVQHQHFEGIEDDDRYLTATKSSVLLDLGGGSEDKQAGLQVRISGQTIPIKENSFEQTRQIFKLYFNKYF